MGREVSWGGGRVHPRGSQGLVAGRGRRALVWMGVGELWMGVGELWMRDLPCIRDRRLPCSPVNGDRA